MLLMPQHLKCNASAKERGRFALNTIALTDKGSLSSDGRILLFIPHTDVDPELAPQVKGVNAQAPKPAGEPFIIDAKEAGEAVKALTTKDKEHDYGFDWTKVIQAEILGDTIVLGGTNLSTQRVLTLSRAPGEFPEVGPVIPDYTNAITFTVDLDYLLQVAKTLRAASKSSTVTLRIIDEETAMGLSCNDGVGMLLMPFEPPHNPDALAAIRDPEAAARRAMEQMSPDLFLAPPMAEVLPSTLMPDDE